MKERAKNALKHDVELLGKRVPVLAMAAMLVIGAGSAAVLTNFGTVTGTAQVEQAIQTEPVFNLDSDNSVEVDEFHSGTDDYVTSQLEVDNDASVTTSVDLETTYSNGNSWDGSAEVTTHYVLSDLRLFETHPSDNGNLEVNFVNPDSGSDSTEFRVSGQVDTHNGGLLHTDYQAEDIADIEEVTYNVETGPSHEPVPFDWAVAVIEMERDVEIDDDDSAELKSGERYYAADWGGESDGSPYSFSADQLYLHEFDAETGQTTTDVGELGKADQLTSTDYSVEGLRFGSGAGTGTSPVTVEVTYTKLQVGDENVLDVRDVFSEASENDGSFTENDVDVGIDEEFNLGVATEIGSPDLEGSMTVKTKVQTSTE